MTSNPIRFPRPLHPGDLIAVTAPSSGVSGAALARLDLVLDYLRSRGYRVVEGECLRNEINSASAPRAQRAQELLRVLNDPQVSAVFPPWGGELASELLALIDFEALSDLEPKWLLGYSDLSTLQMPLTLMAGWATAHGPNLMDLSPRQTDSLTLSALSVLAADFAQPVLQKSSTHYEEQWPDYALQVDAPFNVTARTLWQRLDGASTSLSMRGHLIGGCLDTIALLAGSKYGDVPKFIRESGARGTILYFENAELGTGALVRTLLSLRRHHWFDGLTGVLIGRSAGPRSKSPEALSYADALHAALDDLQCPVIYDVDIGHRPPQFTLVNGAYAEVRFDGEAGSVKQSANAQAFR